VPGGSGYATEYVGARLYRDSILMSIGEGTNDVLRTVIAKSLIKGDARVA
jgi:alkylation response protein AidB-like acyl-CoA dehydrogenase